MLTNPLRRHPLIACALLALAAAGAGCEPTDFTTDASEDAQGDAAPDETSLRALPTEAQQLYGLLMAYRAEYGLPTIPLSASLTAVAQAHARDHMAHGGEVITDNCNAHSWSDQGEWSACCYTADHAQARCMWDKPRELTSYTGNGYEISVWSAGALTPQAALDAWKGSPGHNSVILNQGIWTLPWQAIGVAIEGGYAHVWFGNEPDPASP